MTNPHEATGASGADGPPPRPEPAWVPPGGPSFAAPELPDAPAPAPPGASFAPPPGAPFAPPPGASPPPGAPFVPLPGEAPKPGDAPRTSRLAIASLVLGLIGGSVLAVILAIAALVHIKEGTVKGKGLAIGGLVASLAWVLIIVAGTLASSALEADRDEAGRIRRSGRVLVGTLRTGDCFSGLGSGLGDRMVTARPCTEPHDGEVLAETDVPGGPYPGEERLKARASELCDARLKPLGRSRYAEQLDLYSIHPDSAGWRLGSHRVSCVLHYSGQETLTTPLAATIDPTLRQLSDMAPGDCFRKWSNDAARQHTVPCREPHVSEVYAVRRLPAGPYPGKKTILRKAESFCMARGKAVFKARWGFADISYAYPFEENWKQDERVLVCLAESRHGPTRNRIVPR